MWSQANKLTLDIGLYRLTTPSTKNLIVTTANICYRGRNLPHSFDRRSWSLSSRQKRPSRKSTNSLVSGFIIIYQTSYRQMCTSNIGDLKCQIKHHNINQSSSISIQSCAVPFISRVLAPGKLHTDDVVHRTGFRAFGLPRVEQHVYGVDGWRYQIHLIHPSGPNQPKRVSFTGDDGNEYAIATVSVRSVSTFRFHECQLPLDEK